MGVRYIDLVHPGGRPFDCSRPPLLRQDASALDARMAEVKRVLLEAGLPFGAKADTPQPIEYYPFHHDQKNCKVFWDVRKV